MSKEQILIIEDDEDITELLKYNLTREGYRVASVTSGEESLEAVKANVPDLILLDLMLPGLDGLEVCRLLKRDAQTSQIPIIMVTAKGEEVDIVTGLELGADDYITKPFSPKVLLARVRTVIRRKHVKPKPETFPINIYELEIHPGRHEVRANGVEDHRTQY